jgi:orotate phosphoribosyltransferase
MDWEKLLIQNGAIWQYPGHGIHAAYSLYDKHSDYYFNSDYIVRNPKLLKKACHAMFSAVGPKLAVKPDWIVTYPPYGLNVGFCLADLFGCKFAYIKSLEQPELNFDITKEDSVLFCADDLYTGGSFHKVKNALAKVGAKIQEPLSVIANFSGSKVFDGYEVFSLLEKQINLWDSKACPMCAEGSQAIFARREWHKFAGAIESRDRISPVSLTD